MKPKKLISIFDFDQSDISVVFSMAERLKKDPLAYKNLLNGKALGLIFEKPSTRTWISFDVGFTTLGGNTIYLGPQDIKLGVREEVRDVARVLARYLDAVVMRTFSHKLIVEFARYFDKPVINGLSDAEHPCQILGDFFTVKEIFGSLKNRKIAYVGDGNNVLNSLLLLAARLGATFSYATPKEYEPEEVCLKRAMKEAEKTGAKIEGFHQPEKAVQGADVVYTDVWLSMGEEDQVEKVKFFKKFQVNESLLKHAKKHVRFMHCLPAHRGEEVTDEVMEGKHSIVFDQAENRLHIQKAILVYLLGMSF